MRFRLNTFVKGSERVSIDLSIRNRRDGLGKRGEECWPSAPSMRLQDEEMDTRYLLKLPNGALMEMLCRKGDLEAKQTADWGSVP